MKTKYLLILSFFVLIGCDTGNKKKEEHIPKKSSDTTFLSLYFMRNDEISKTTKGEIFVFGKYADGKYFPVNDYDTKTQQLTNEKKEILDSHKHFTTYYKGRILINLQIETVESSTYDCEELFVGKCNNNITQELLKKRINEYSQARSGGMNGKDIQYSLTNFFAMSSSIAQLENIFPENQIIDSTQTSTINEHLKAKFESHCDSISLNMTLDRKFTSQINFKTENTPVFVTISTCSDTTKELFMSLLYIFKISKNKIEPLFEKFENVGIDSWGSGYEFIDAVDIDSDNNPELIFMVEGYESSGLVIYRYNEGKFILVFETSLYGC